MTETAEKRRGKGRPKTLESAGALPGVRMSSREILNGMTVDQLADSLAVDAVATLTWAARVAAQNIAPLYGDHAYSELIDRVRAQIEGGLIRAGRRTQEVPEPLDAFLDALQANLRLQALRTQK
jgi:hypothetical protein